VDVRDLRRDQDGGYYLNPKRVRFWTVDGVFKFNPIGARYRTNRALEDVFDFDGVSTKVGSPCIDNLKPRVLVHCHVVIVHPEMTQDEVKAILKRTFKGKRGVDVSEIEDRYDRWGRRMDGVEFVCAILLNHRWPGPLASTSFVIAVRTSPGLIVKTFTSEAAVSAAKQSVRRKSAALAHE
jgi:hypothetical protein